MNLYDYLSENQSDQSNSSDSYSSDQSDDDIDSDNHHDNEYLNCIFHNFHDKGYCHITWKLVMRDSSIKSIQEPISEMLISKYEFDKAYHEFMVTLDGRDITSFADFFWRRSAVDCSCLEFVDRDTRMDIYEYLRDENLVPDMAKVHSGDWKFKK